MKKLKNRKSVSCLFVLFILLAAYYFIPVSQQHLLPQSPDFISITVETVEPGKDPIKVLVRSSDSKPALRQTMEQAFDTAHYHRSFGDKKLANEQISVYFTKDGQVTHLALDRKVLIVWDAKDAPHYYQSYSENPLLDQLLQEL